MVRSYHCDVYTLRLRSMPVGSERKLPPLHCGSQLLLHFFCVRGSITWYGVVMLDNTTRAQSPAHHVCCVHVLHLRTVIECLSCAVFVCIIHTCIRVPHSSVSHILFLCLYCVCASQMCMYVPHTPVCLTYVPHLCVCASQQVHYLGSVWLHRQLPTTSAEGPRRC